MIDLDLTTLTDEQLVDLLDDLLAERRRRTHAAAERRQAPAPQRSNPRPIRHLPTSTDDDETTCGLPLRTGQPNAPALASTPGEITCPHCL